MWTVFGVCNFTGQPPSTPPSSELILSYVYVMINLVVPTISAWPLILPPVYFPSFFRRTNSRSKCTWEQLALQIWTYHRTHQTVFIFTLSVVISFVLICFSFLGLYETCKNLWTVFKIDICILDYFKNDRLHIFSLIFILREKNKCIIYF